ncbi:ATPase inhibitor [Vermiconidia calcicola]|uniref:ATPase inhibitor n=1 Tax=Vermiconidia calcicola TaxID=1690605 RepID=A0ACC3MQ16_9PEZI|nr:ATPase inhibitor [Vermiconidia calcicola]
MDQPNTNTSQPPPDPFLDLITLNIVRSSALDDDTKSFFIHHVKVIQIKLAPIDWLTPEAWSWFDNWIELSEVFYEQAGISGRVIGSWTMEDKMNDMTTNLASMDMEQQKEEVDLDLDGAFDAVLQEVWNKMVEEAGDTGSLRAGGERAGDSWSRREKASEDMYIRDREKQIMQMLKQKIADQEMKLAKDRAILSAMEDQYGHHAEEKAS